MSDGYGSANLRADGGDTAESSADGMDRFEGLDEVTSLDEVYDAKRAGDALAIVALEDTAMREAADVSLYTLTSNSAGARKFSKTTVQDGTRTTGSGNAWGAMQMHAESDTSVVYRVPYEDFEEIEDLANPDFTVDVGPLDCPHCEDGTRHPDDGACPDCARRFADAADEGGRL